MPSLPYFSWYPGDYANDTRELSDDADLLYRRLLDAMWLEGGSLPDDERALARLTGMHLRKFRRSFAEVSPKLSQKWIGDNRRLIHERLHEQWKEAKRVQELRAKAGRARAAAHAGKSESFPQAHGAQPDPDPSNHPRSKPETPVAGASSVSPESPPVNSRAKRSSAKVKAQIDPDWGPPEAIEAYCRERNYPRPSVWWKRFQETFQKNGTRHKDWTLTAKVWIRNEAPGGDYHHPQRWEGFIEREKQMRQREEVRAHGEVRARAAAGMSTEHRERGRGGVRQLKDILAGAGK